MKQRGASFYYGHPSDMYLLVRKINLLKSILFMKYGQIWLTSHLCKILAFVHRHYKINSFHRYITEFPSWNMKDSSARARKKARKASYRLQNKICGINSYYAFPVMFAVLLWFLLSHHLYSQFAKGNFPVQNRSKN